jgi:hypothetical protein
MFFLIHLLRVKTLGIQNCSPKLSDQKKKNSLLDFKCIRKYLSFVKQLESFMLHYYILHIYLFIVIWDEVKRGEE